MVFLKLLIFMIATCFCFAQQKCGQTPVPPAIDSKIVGGHIATPYSWPWQVVWCWNEQYECGYACSGTVIGQRWAMTAGHCVYGNTNNGGHFRVKTAVFDQTQS